MELLKFCKGLHTYKSGYMLSVIAIPDKMMLVITMVTVILVIPVIYKSKH